jgi:hypothetical protein
MTLDKIAGIDKELIAARKSDAIPDTRLLFSLRCNSCPGQSDSLGGSDKSSTTVLQAVGIGALPLPSTFLLLSGKPPPMSGSQQSA